MSSDLDSPDSPALPLPLSQRLAKRKRSTASNITVPSDASESKRRSKSKKKTLLKTKTKKKTTTKQQQQQQQQHPLSSTLVQLFSCSSPEAALSFLRSSTHKTKSLMRKQRKRLAQLAGLERAWIDCDQNISLNVDDLSSSLVDELYLPLHFYIKSMEQSSPRALFGARQATSPLLNSSWPWHHENMTKSTQQQQQQQKKKKVQQAQAQAVALALGISTPTVEAAGAG